jgi:hypothetical protein
MDDIETTRIIPITEDLTQSSVHFDNDHFIFKYNL